MSVDGIIFSQRVSFPINRHHDPLQVRMITKRNAKKIEDFTLVPVRASPDRCDGIQFNGLAKPYAQAESGRVPNRVEKIDDLKSRLAGPPINPGYCAQTLESGFLF